MQLEGSKNRSFGILFFIVFLIIFLWPLLNNNQPKWLFLFIAFIFLTLGILNSKILTPLNRFWIKLGELLGRVVAPVVMMLIFFALITPLGLLVKIFGKDLLDLKFKKSSSYWVHRKNKISSMKKQF